MSRVEIPAPGDLIMDDDGNVRANETVSLTLAGTSTDVTHYSALTGGTSTTGGLKSGVDGTIVDGSGNRRYVDSGDALDLTILGRTRQIDPLSAGADVQLFNVKAHPYKARGDGTTDDTTAIAAALAAAITAHGTLYFPPGTYKTTAALSLTAAVRITGAGMVASVISNAVTDVFTTPDVAAITDVTFADIHLVGAVGGGHVFSPGLTGTTNVLGRWVFDRVRISQLNTAKSLWHQVDQGGMVGFKFTDCLFYHSAATPTVPGFHLKSGGQIINSNSWTRCIPTYSGEYFFHIENTTAGYAYDNAFHDCIGEVLVGGFAKILSGKNTIFENVQNWDMQGIGSSTRDWFYIGKSASGLASVYTTFRNCNRAGGTLGGGLVDIKLETGNVTRTTISNAHHDSLAGYAVDAGGNSIEYQGHGGLGLTLTNPHVPSVAAASTTTLASGALRNPGFCQITGATSITNLTATFPGHVVTLVFSSSPAPLVVSRTGNIILPGGNFQATQNSSLTLTCDGGTWYGGEPGQDAALNEAAAMGLAAWSFDGSLGSTNAAPVAGRRYLIALFIPGGTLVSNLHTDILTAGAGTVPTSIFLGLSSLTSMVAVTADDKASATWTSANILTTTPVVTPVFIPVSGMYYVHIVQVGSWGTTQMVLSRAVNHRLKSGGAIPQATISGDAQTGVPSVGASPGTLVATNALRYWVGVS